MHANELSRTFDPRTSVVVCDQFFLLGNTHWYTHINTMRKSRKIVKSKLEFVTIFVLIGTMGVIFWQAKVAHDESKYKTRPLLCISTIELVQPSQLQHGILHAKFKVKNLGTLPSKDLKADISLYSAGVVVTPEHEQTIKPRCLMPGQEFGVHEVKLTGQRVHDIWNKKEKLICKSLISYTDERGRSYFYNSEWEFTSLGPTRYGWVCIEADYR